MKKITTLVLSLFLVFGFALAGCGSSKDGNGSKTKEGSKSNSITVTYNDQGDATQGTTDWLESVKKDFEEANSGVTVNIEPIKSSGGDFFTKLSLTLGSESAPDVFTEDTFRINDDAAAGYLEPLNNYLDEWDDWENFTDSVKEGVTAVDGNVYGVPYNTDVRGLWYNEKIFEKSGISTPWEPKTWDDVLEAARTVKEKVSDVVPLWFSSGKAEGEATSMDTFQMLLTGTNDELFDMESEKWAGKSKGFKESLEFIDTVYKEEIGPDLSNVLNAQAAASLLTEYMPNNEVAISMNGSWVPRMEGTENYKFTPMPTKDGQDPGFTSMSGGWTLSIANKSKNKDLAWKFIEMATDKEHNKDYILKMNDLTTRADLAEDEEILNSTRAYEQTVKAVQYTHYRPAVEKYSQVSGAIQEAVESVVIGDANPSEAMEKYLNDLKRIVGEENIIEK